MRITLLKSVFTALIFLALLVISQSGASAYPVKPFDLQRLLDGSTVVVKVQVLAVEEHGTCLDPRISNAKPVTQVIAHFKRLAEIKGEIAEEFDIAYPSYDNRHIMAPYPQLDKEQVCVAFLSGGKAPYHFFDLDQPILTLCVLELAYEPNQLPKERLMAELRAVAAQTEDYRRTSALSLLMDLGDKDAKTTLQAVLFATAQHSQGATQLAAIEQLGYLGDRDAIIALQANADKQDIALYGQILIASVIVKAPPSSAELLAFLQRDAKEFDDNASVKRFNTTGYCLDNLQRSLLWAICGSIKQSDGNDHTVTKLENFPYVDFFRQSLQTPGVKQDRNRRDDIGRALREMRDPQSVPFLIELLDSAEINYFAVTALASITHMNGMYINGYLFEKEPQKYISFWRNWWKQHQQEY